MHVDVKFILYPKDHTWTDITYSYYNNTETESKLEGFLQADTDGPLEYCSMAEHERTGFVRTEEIFKIFTKIFEESKVVTMATSCTVTGLALAASSSGAPNDSIDVSTETSDNAAGMRDATVYIDI